MLPYLFICMHYLYAETMISHKHYMALALKLAAKAKGNTSPNPMVGCVILKRNKIVGQGYHKKAGEAHAEAIALVEAGKKAKDSTLYVNLEPCSHWGRTPPCTEAIVSAGVREVIIGCDDPNPKVSGYQELKFRGIKTKIGILDEECKKLNECYLKWISTGMPFVVVKAAMSLDGRIATKTGDSRYITGKDALKFVHQLRSEVDAVMVGINTILRDDPQLTVRLVKGEEPVKIVLDSRLRIPLRAKVLGDAAKVIIATTSKAPKAKMNKLLHMGVQVLSIKSDKGRVDVKELLSELGRREITSIMVEGGATLNSEILRKALADKLLMFYAPSLIGKGTEVIGDLGITSLNKSIKLRDMSTRKIGKDILIEAYV